ncbi:uncharacterized protein LOC133037863 [Cannabis sativa]|uniref:uncharacterized protein LOC133037863 n=1 Tax=Cannabis sativa TaxID=3483 RepID=UPI0029C9BADE|nr:uncharacterized protein LOC133037863 [Cannabis sativa]
MKYLFFLEDGWTHLMNMKISRKKVQKSPKSDKGKRKYQVKIVQSTDLFEDIIRKRVVEDGNPSTPDRNTTIPKFFYACFFFLYSVVFLCCFSSVFLCFFYRIVVDLVIFSLCQILWFFPGVSMILVLICPSPTTKEVPFVLYYC